LFSETGEDVDDDVAHCRATGHGLPEVPPGPLKETQTAHDYVSEGKDESDDECGDVGHGRKASEWLVARKIKNKSIFDRIYRIDRIWFALRNPMNSAIYYSLILEFL